MSNSPEQIVDRLRNAPQLPIDAGGNAIPAMAPRPGKAHKKTVSSSSVKQDVAFDSQTQVVSMYVEGNGIHLEFGDANVVATTNSHFFPEGIYYDFALRKGHTHVAMIRSASTDATVYMSEKW